MTEDEFWTRWCIVWKCIGWRALAERSNYTTGDVLDVCTALMARVMRLESMQVRSLWSIF